MTKIELTPEQKTEALKNFQAKYKMSEQEARKHINEAFNFDPEYALKLLRECY